MTKRRVERLLDEAKENGEDDREDAPEEVVVEVGGVPARGPEEDGPRPAAEGGSFEAFRVDLETGEVKTLDRPDPDDLPECGMPDCPNPAMPFEDESVCEKCADMPRRDWRPVIRENEENRPRDNLSSDTWLS